MSKLINPTKRGWFKVAVVTGVLLSIIGVGLWLYANSVIQNHEQLLNSPNLTQEETWRYEGSLQWWRTAYITTFYPATVISINIGLVVLLCPVLWATVQKTRARKTFEDDFQRALGESY